MPVKLHIIWDCLPAYRGTALRKFLAQGGALRIQAERLSGYAPDLNPGEGAKRYYLKYLELGNIYCVDLDHVWSELRQATAHLPHKTDVIQACFHHVFGQNFTLSSSG
jgi:hypothetical protein